MEINLYFIEKSKKEKEKITMKPRIINLLY